MKVRRVLAVLLLSAASMWAQAGAAATPDAAKPADHAACKRDKDSKMACCKKDKDGNMVKGEKCKREKGACCKKMESEKKS